MKRGVFQIHAHTRTGEVGLVDVLDLDEESFRAWLLGQLQRCGMLSGPRPEEVRGAHVEVYERGARPQEASDAKVSESLERNA